jgi:hypothetical protein
MALCRVRVGLNYCLTTRNVTTLATPACTDFKPFPPGTSIDDMTKMQTPETLRTSTKQTRAAQTSIEDETDYPPS